MRRAIQCDFHAVNIGAAAIVGLLLLMMSLHADASQVGDSEALARQVKIHRDAFGVPHIFGRTDESTFFGFGYAQSEDYFWQVEDAYILALGRYAEIHGPKGLNSDKLNRAFEIVTRSKRDYAALDATSQRLYSAFVAGINYYLETHPNVRPRLITKFEPWHVLAYYRHIALELSFRFTGLSSEYLPRRNPHVWAASGSNGWVIDGKRTASSSSMLLANPHMPSFGFAQLAEAHLRSDGGGTQEPWNFVGAGFYGCPTLALGHNERLGWTLVTNQPDIADTWRINFNHSSDPLAYEYDGDYRKADAWTETIRVRKARGMDDRKFEFRKTHHGPIVAAENDGARLAARICGIFETIPLRQSLHMMRASNLEEFREALGLMQILYMNVLYADCDGNIQFVYTGRVPRRNPNFDWSRPLDGSDPATEWLGYHSLDELPQVVNPAAGFLQNCNSTPLMVTDGDNPRPEDYPQYMIGDADQYRRRALRSMQLLRGMHDVTFDRWQAAAFDTQVYWATQELPRYAEHFQELKTADPALFRRVKPYLEHLLAWDARITADSTAATVCHAWYEQLHGTGYPGEQMRPTYVDDLNKQLLALVRATQRLKAIHGDWRVPYGDLYRSQRIPRLADLVKASFDDSGSSTPSLGGHGPMGTIFTQYYTPSIEIPWIISQRRRYGIVGTSYLAAYEFTPKGVRGASVVPFGTSGDPNSPHFNDQAELLVQQKLKPEHFTKQQVLQAAVRSYHPGE
ncbi:MAG: penicillin acylase family protein [Planctomycetota bacterium]